MSKDDIRYRPSIEPMPRVNTTPQVRFTDKEWIAMNQMTQPFIHGQNPRVDQYNAVLVVARSTPCPRRGL
jgi:hypothetical protein